MNGTFELNVPGNYTVELFEENHFLNDKNSPADLAKFGKTYSVKFSGDAETYLWTTKTEPVEGKAYYGHIQPTSGKMLRFKVDKLEDGNFSTGPSMQEGKAYLKDVTDIPVRFMQSLLQYYDVQKLATDPTQYENYLTLVKMLSEDALLLIENVRKDGGSQETGRPTLPPPQIKAVTQTPATSLGDTFRNRNAPEPPPGDDDIPPEFL